MRNKKAQEEMIGFVLIVVLVSIILLILLRVYLNSDSNNGNLESLQVENYLSSLLQTTSECQIAGNYLDYRELVFSCIENRNCENIGNSCDYLEKFSKNALNVSWPTENKPEKAYSYFIKEGNSSYLGIEKGNFTGNFIGGIRDYSRSGQNIEISLRVYY
jgi:hypothetical protein